MGITLVTGASSGIGRASALAMAERGDGVILTYNGNKDGAEEAVAAIRQAGGTAVALRLDVGDSSTFPSFVDEVRDTLESVWQTDRITSLVNNAGIGGGTKFADTTEERFDDLVNVLFRGVFFLTQRLLPVLADGSAIVNVASSSARSNPIDLAGGYSAYAACKGAVIVLTRHLAVELSDRRIRVNSVSPGPTHTSISGNAFDKMAHLVPELASKTLLGRLGDPRDIGAMVAVLLSEEGQWITGQDIEVSGGYRLGV
ncbi:SDR family NAD(P)-dependent oxidoreductase [Kutzneria sp. CA-103260]|uniref:SDR family NAD(P)-dependent oxidoreductase n=1 Tax=Kutzneria sp. CA-103260 TaxID=2802641 RepID=UPI001BA8175D|nr:SDR family oxidoreductase [Kutzneria sp. CA-103260]QUQ63646.1 short-chain dehydrogenase [Kutzneria sp. CA-103260]